MYLVVARKSIKETQQLEAESIVDEVINSRKRVGVHRALFIQAGVVNTHSPLVRRHFHQDNIYQPL